MKHSMEENAPFSQGLSRKTGPGCFERRRYGSRRCLQARTCSLFSLSEFFLSKRPTGMLKMILRTERMAGALSSENMLFPACSSEGGSRTVLLCQGCQGQIFVKRKGAEQRHWPFSPLFRGIYHQKKKLSHCPRTAQRGD